jgi:hypothetical protein
MLWLILLRKVSSVLPYHGLNKKNVGRRESEVLYLCLLENDGKKQE